MKPSPGTLQALGRIRELYTTNQLFLDHTSRKTKPTKNITLCPEATRCLETISNLQFPDTMLGALTKPPKIYVVTKGKIDRTPATAKLEEVNEIMLWFGQKKL